MLDQWIFFSQLGANFTHDETKPLSDITGGNLPDIYI